MKRYPTFCSLGIGLLFGAMFGGCSTPSMPDRERQGVEAGLLERASPENVLHNLQTIYSEKDDVIYTIEDAHYWAERYGKLFHPDFKFYFAPGEAPPGFPEGWWGLDDEVAAFESLLVAVVSGQVEDVELSWTLNPAVPDDRVDEHDQLLHPDWKWIHVTSVLLDLVEVSGQTWRVASGTADFYFSLDPGDSTLWVVSEWWDGERWIPSSDSDIVSGTQSVDVTSWGLIKGMFR